MASKKEKRIAVFNALASKPLNREFILHEIVSLVWRQATIEVNFDDVKECVNLIFSGKCVFADRHLTIDARHAGNYCWRAGESDYSQEQKIMLAEAKSEASIASSPIADTVVPATVPPDDLKQKMSDEIGDGIVAVLCQQDVKAGMVCATCGESLYSDEMHFVRSDFHADGSQIGITEYFCHAQCLEKHYGKVAQ